MRKCGAASIDAAERRNEITKQQRDELTKLLYPFEVEIFSERLDIRTLCRHHDRLFFYFDRAMRPPKEDLNGQWNLVELDTRPSDARGLKTDWAGPAGQWLALFEEAYSPLAAEDLNYKYMRNSACRSIACTLRGSLPGVVQGLHLDAGQCELLRRNLLKAVAIYYNQESGQYRFELDYGAVLQAATHLNSLYVVSMISCWHSAKNEE
jgi:hypothetical protein